MNILEYLRENDIAVSSACGGMGSCGKCLVSVNGGSPERACRREYEPGMDIRVLSDEEDMSVLIDLSPHKPFEGRLPAVFFRLLSCFSYTFQLTRPNVSEE